MNNRCLMVILLVLAAAVILFVLAAVAVVGPDRFIAIGLALVALALLLKALCCECRPKQTTPGTVGQTKM